MGPLITLFLRFHGRSYPTWYRFLSLVPGTIVFLVISPAILFLLASRVASLVPLTCSRSLEQVLAMSALSLALILMGWGLVALWRDGQGTPAPIAPTRRLVTSGPYRLCRNPIELGTDLYFFFLGTWFDDLVTGVLTMGMGMLLGFGYIRFIEEKELFLRFGDEYAAYHSTTPLFFPSFRMLLSHDRKTDSGKR